MDLQNSSSTTTFEHYTPTSEHKESSYRTKCFVPELTQSHFELAINLVDSGRIIVSKFSENGKVTGDIINNKDNTRHSTISFFITRLGTIECEVRKTTGPTLR